MSRNKPRKIKHCDHIYQPGDIIVERYRKAYYLVMEAKLVGDSPTAQYVNRYWSYYNLQDLQTGQIEQFRFLNVNNTGWKKVG
jgi:hypothetical protein